MVNVGYHTARTQGKMMRCVYKLVHLTMHYNHAKPLCTKRYVLSVDDQFIYPDKYAGKEIALRHYLNDVRHKFWFHTGI
jgi:hypothetical protein